MTSIFALQKRLDAHNKNEVFELFPDEQIVVRNIFEIFDKVNTMFRRSAFDTYTHGWNAAVEEIRKWLISVPHLESSAQPSPVRQPQSTETRSDWRAFERELKELTPPKPTKPSAPSAQASCENSSPSVQYPVPILEIALTRDGLFAVRWPQDNLSQKLSCEEARLSIAHAIAEAAFASTKQRQHDSVSDKSPTASKVSP